MIATFTPDRWPHRVAVRWVALLATAAWLLIIYVSLALAGALPLSAPAIFLGG